MKRLSIIFFIILSSLLYSQEYVGNKKLIGYVFTKKNIPAEKAFISLYLPKIKKGFELNTDKRGKFEAENIKKGLWRIRIYKFGYFPVEIYKFVDTDKTKIRDILLKKIHTSEISDQYSKDIDNGIIYFIKNKYKKSIKIFEKLIKNNPNSILLNSVLAESYYYSGKYDKAPEFYSRVLKTNEEKNRIKEKIISCFIRKGVANRKLNEIKSFNINKSYNPLILTEIGVFFYKRGEFEDSVRYLLKSIELYPEDSQAHYYLGLSYTSMNKPEKAIKHLKRFIELDPDSPDTVIADSIINTFKEMEKKRKK